MENLSCRVISVGEVSLWAKHFLNGLRSAGNVEIGTESTLASFSESHEYQEPQILVLENFPESRQTIQKLRDSQGIFIIIWYGRLFTKEDFPFAIQKRIYAVLENLRHDDPLVLEVFKKASIALEKVKQQAILIRSVKAILLQAEGDIAPPLMAELRTALSKLENIGLGHEMTGGPKIGKQEADPKLFFHKTEAMSDVLETVHNLERTGVLWIKSYNGEEEGRIDFLQGKIIGAVVGEVKGLKSIYRMFLWDQPKFLFMRREPQESVVEEHINLSMSTICEEGENYRRQFHLLRRDLPPPDLNLELESGSLHAGMSLEPNTFLVLANVIEYRMVRRILNYNPLSDVEVYEALIRLRKSNMIKIAA